MICSAVVRMRSSTITQHENWGLHLYHFAGWWALGVHRGRGPGGHRRASAGFPGGGRRTCFPGRRTGRRRGGVPERGAVCRRGPFAGPRPRRRTGRLPAAAHQEQTVDNVSCTSLGSAHGVEGEHTASGATRAAPPSPGGRKPLSRHGVVQAKVPAASATPGRGILGGRVGGPGVCAGSPGVGGGPCELPGSFSVAFQIPSDEGTPAEEQDSDSDQEKPNKHRARHARLRRSESLSEKQVKEAKSKCKRIALLLSAAQPNPNNKGLLMFKKHRQRAKKYTLVSYGTGEDERDDSTEEDEENTRGGIHVVEFTLADQDRSDLEKHFLANARGGKGVLTICLDKSLLDVERKETPMECLPETKGKGALMFAKRRQRMDEIAAEHEELRRQGMPVEGAQKVKPASAQPTAEDHAYMDVNLHQQCQYQQFQEQQYYEQQQQYQQYQQQQYEQQQLYHQDQQVQVSGNRSVKQQSHEAQSSSGNRTAKPFSVQNMAATTYSPAVSGTNQYSTVQGEQIASRDERISTPAIKSGILDSKRRNIGKPMFAFKEPPKMSPNPELLNLLNMSYKKMGFESGPEEDYLSLGAEACNFLHSSGSKHKTPPPVAPKPLIDPSTAPWSPQMEVTNHDTPQHAENSASTPAVATPSNNQEPTSIVPAPGPSPPQAQLEAPANAGTQQQQTWPPSAPENQQQQVTVQEGNGQVRSSPQPDSNAGRIWDTAQVAQQQPTISCYPQPQEPHLSQSTLQLQWATPQPTHCQAQSQPPADTWTPQLQASWNQAEQAESHAQPSWCQPQDPPQSQTQPNWTHTPEPQVQQMPPNWVQPQEPMLQHQLQVSWAQPPQVDSQPIWGLAKSQDPWVQPESQPQPPWGQPAHQKAWSQTQAPDQHWPPAHPQQQPPINTWHPSQPSWTQTAHAQPPTQPVASLNPWGPVPAQPQPQPSWAQQPAEQVQCPASSWGSQQGPVQHQPSWVQSDRPQPQPTWQQAPLKTAPQPPMNVWPPAQPQTPARARAPQSQQTPAANAPALPKPWNTQQNRDPQRINAFTSGQRVSSPVNPLATVLNPSSAGSAYEMPAVRGKGADMFAKRQSRMEKYVVDSETVQANMASRSASPAASLPNEWKYTPNVRAPPSRGFNPIQSPSYPPAASKQPPSSGPMSKAKKKGKQGPAPKPLDVVDVMKHQPYQLSASLFIYGPAAEAAKEPTPKPGGSPQNQQPYEQMAPVQPAGTFSASYPQQAYEGNYQPTAYPPTDPYQQSSGGPYWQPYNQQSSQLPNPQCPLPQVPYQAAGSPPYCSPPAIAFQQSPPANVAPSFPVASPPGSTSSGNPSAAPKPKFTAQKSSAQETGRRYSLSPPCRSSSTGHQSSSSRHPAQGFSQTSWLEKTFKVLTPWEAASHHPLGLVDEAFAFQDLQQNLASSIRLAAQRKLAPEPPAQWTARASPQKAGACWGRGPGRGAVSSTGGRVGYGSLPRKWQPPRSVTHMGSPSEGKRPPRGLHRSRHSTDCNWEQ
ncbi:synaptopodin-2 isoform X2 [Phycodurus eques]|uniref:synaptopodin-2 isoform X2 n=1 Tax=Phycodurus eques TaxID=693459 RepID=UPI002ACD4FBF|nr:synaptopodin-2 isoform X2 [Phycodurus eques]